MSEKVQIEMLMESSGLNHDQINMVLASAGADANLTRYAKCSGNSMVRFTRRNNGLEGERSREDGSPVAGTFNDPKKGGRSAIL